MVIIDDCKLTLAIARDIMEDAGYDVETAESGIAANSFIYQTPPPALILIDVVMPMLNGDRKVKLLKDRDSSSNIPVVLMSSKSAEELQALKESSGADGFVPKPLNRDELLDEVRRLI
ncbi:MAG: response regulator [Desulfuromonadales bacterium]|nr:response regulator [Desulfuromonadales bacterium]NIR33136.1 response regulator [Desulfuromonadales bacterium]NIS43138.1 response regulator [Desulfuromonadales bacterium]